MFDKFDPLNLPLKRRIEIFTTGLFLHYVLFGGLFFIFALTVILIYGSYFWKTVAASYLIFMYYDKECGINTAGRRQGSKWVRDWKIWKIFGDYFSAKLIKTVDLPSNRNYIFAAYPHGLLSFGAFVSFATNALGYHKLFPGLRAKVVTLPIHFQAPIYREICLAWGLISSKQKSIESVLSASHDPNDPYNDDGFTGNVVVIIVGGAQESLYLRPRNYRIVLKKRKGFVRLAIKHGASIVPVITFNEVDTYNQPPNPPGSKLRSFQDWVKSKTGMSPVIYMGRGFFQWIYGIIPLSVPLTTVVGAPIDVIKNENPTDEEIEKYHAIYTKDLVNLFETHKSKYTERSDELQLIIE